MKRYFVIFISIGVLMGLGACSYTDIVADDGSDIVVSEDLSFSTDIEPIFKTQGCTNCHPAMHQPDLAAGFAYESLINGGYIDTDKPGDSKIYTVPAPDGTHSAKLTTKQAATILAWIEQGAQDN